MSVAMITVVAGVGALGMVVLLALVAAHRCRVVAILASFGSICVFGSNTTPTTLWTAVALGGPLLLAIAWYRRGLAVGRAGIAMGTSAAFLALVLLSSGLSGHGLPAFVPLAVALGWTTSQLDGRERVAVFRGVVVIGLVESTYAAAQAFLGARPLWGLVASQGTDNPFTEGLDRVQASFGQAIVYGFFSAVVAFLAWSDAARLPRSLRLLAFGVLIGGLFLSGTRSAAVALVAAIAVHALLRPGLLKWVRNLALTLLGVTLVGLLDFGIRAVVSEALDSGSWLQRLGSVSSVPRLLARPGSAYWFGSGFGSEQELYRTGLLTSPYHFTVVDNFYVYTLGTTGLVGLVFLLAVLVVAFVTSGRTGRGIVLIVAVMCAAFDLLAWRSTAAVFVFLLVLDPPRRVRASLEPDETTGEVAISLEATPTPAEAPNPRRTTPSTDLTREPLRVPAVDADSVPSPHIADPATSLRAATVMEAAAGSRTAKRTRRSHGTPI